MISHSLLVEQVSIFTLHGFALRIRKSRLLCEIRNLVRIYTIPVREAKMCWVSQGEICTFIKNITDLKHLLLGLLNIGINVRYYFVSKW